MKVELIIFAICWIFYIVIYLTYNGDSRYVSKILICCIAFTFYIMASYGRRLLNILISK